MSFFEVLHVASFVSRVMPNVYVSYQTLSSISPASTPVVVCSSSPRWEYQKLERITYSSIKLQVKPCCYFFFLIILLVCFYLLFEKGSPLTFRGDLYEKWDFCGGYISLFRVIVLCETLGSQHASPHSGE